MEGKSFFEFTPHWDILSRFTSMLFHASYSLLVAIMIVASQTTTTTTTTAASASPPGISPEFLAARMGSVLMISGLMRSALVMASSLLYKRIGIGATETVLLGVASAVFAWVLKLWQ